MNQNMRGAPVKAKSFKAKNIDSDEIEKNYFSLQRNNHESVISRVSDANSNYTQGAHNTSDVTTAIQSKNASMLIPSSSGPSNCKNRLSDITKNGGLPIASS